MIIRDCVQQSSYALLKRALSVLRRLLVFVAVLFCCFRIALFSAVRVDHQLFEIKRVYIFALLISCYLNSPTKYSNVALAQFIVTDVGISHEM